MKELQSILFGVALREVVGSTKQLVNDIQIDSRKATPSSVFVAIGGVHVDGHHFIETAIEKGATVIVCEQLPEGTMQGITYLVVENSSIAVAVMAHQFYN
jgi:UDP-N-acetylmuramoyl-L-alanyl-D-glutamate--2,6-diaminopimelate ligase